MPHVYHVCTSGFAKKHLERKILYLEVYPWAQHFYPAGALHACGDEGAKDRLSNRYP